MSILGFGFKVSVSWIRGFRFWNLGLRLFGVWGFLYEFLEEGFGFLVRGLGLRV